MIENEDAVCRSVIQAWLAMELKGLEGLMYWKRDTYKPILWLGNRKRIFANLYFFCKIAHDLLCYCNMPNHGAITVLCKKD